MILSVVASVCGSVVVVVRHDCLVWLIVVSPFASVGAFDSFPIANEESLATSCGH